MTAVNNGQPQQLNWVVDAAYAKATAWTKKWVTFQPGSEDSRAVIEQLASDTIARTYKELAQLTETDAKASKSGHTIVIDSELVQNFGISLIQDMVDSNHLRVTDLFKQQYHTLHRLTPREVNAAEFDTKDAVASAPAGAMSAAAASAAPAAMPAPVAAPVALPAALTIPSSPTNAPVATPTVITSP